MSVKNFVINSNVNEINKNNIAKVELLFNLNGEKYPIKDISCTKSIACLCGCCTLVDDNTQESVILDKPNMIVEIPQNISLVIKDYSADSKIIITYSRNE